MDDCDYYAPTDLADAVKHLSQSGARALAGGTDLLLQIRSGLQRPAAIVDLKNIADLGQVQIDAARVRVGSTVSGAELTANAALTACYPGVVEAAGLIGSTQVQGRATIGGNLCNGSPAADSVPALIAAGGVCDISGVNGERQIPVAELLIGPGQLDLQPGEIVAAIVLPRPAPGQADAYCRFIPRTEMDIAVAGVAVNLTLDDQGVCRQARVVIGGVAPTALLVPQAGDALVGTKLDATALAAAGAAASAAAKPISDKRGTAEFRRKIVGVLTRRVARIAADRTGRAG
ncbi:MAG: xanthine dehydrogenase family protein subunit M [Gammaproteobacteria bacterium]